MVLALHFEQIEFGLASLPVARLGVSVVFPEVLAKRCEGILKD